MRDDSSLSCGSVSTKSVKTDHGRGGDISAKSLSVVRRLHFIATLNCDSLRTFAGTTGMALLAITKLVLKVFQYKLTMWHSSRDDDSVCISASRQASGRSALSERILSIALCRFIS